MDDEQKQLVAMDRAAKADQILSNEMLQEAFSELEKTYMAAWRETGAAETEIFKRERLWLAVNLIGKVQEHLRMVIHNGKLSQAHLAKITRKNAA